VAAENSPNSAAPDTIVLVHGFWVSPRSWEKWIERFRRYDRQQQPPNSPIGEYHCTD
jgi:hypothetical protein